jgi:hypothetical protein
VKSLDKEIRKMAVRKESTTSSDAGTVSEGNAKQAYVARKKTSAVAQPKVAGRKSAVAAKKATAKETPVQAKTQVAKKSVASKRPATTAPTATRQKPAITGEQRQQMICEAAYLISSKRPHCTGSPEIDWFQAEAVIDMIFDVSG